jgi:uncharacterized membrane protein YfcA
MIPTSIIGILAHYRQGSLIPQLAVPLGVGCFIGSYITAHQANHIDEKPLQKIFPLVMTGLGLNALRQGLRMVR